MKKESKFKLRTLTDIKVFLLFLLDRIRYPIDYTTLSKIISENVDEVTIDYYECLRELVDSGHLLMDDMDGEKYYMISQSGKQVSAELYDRLDPEFREMSIKSAAKHISLSDKNTEITAKIRELPDKRFEVILGATDEDGKVFTLSLTVASRIEAERMTRSFEANPLGIYKGILFCVTGRMEFLP